MDERVQCPYCTSNLALRSLRKHLNQHHVGFATTAAVSVHRLAVCPHCSKCWSNRTVERHAIGCQVAVAPVPVTGAPVPPAPAVAEPVAAPPVGQEDLIAGPVDNGPVDAGPVEIGPEAPPAIAAEAPDAHPVVAADHDGDGDDDVDLGAFAQHAEAAMLTHFAMLSDTPELPLVRLTGAHRQALISSVEALALAYLDAASAALLFRLLALPKLGMAAEIGETRRRCRIIVNGTLPQVYELFSTRRRCRHPGAMPAPPLPNFADPGPALTALESRRIINHVGRGYLSKAAGVIKSGASVAPASPAVIEELRRLHPAGPPNPFGDRVGAHVQMLGAEIALQTMDTVVKGLSTQTSPGISGWSAHLIGMCYKPTSSFRQFLCRLGQQVRKGDAPGLMLLLACRLTPLQPDPGRPAKIRPIANGEMLLKVCVRFSLRTLLNGQELLPCQLGVGSPGGVEPLTHYTEMVYEANVPGAADPVHTHMYALDLTNAFNSVDRAYAAGLIHRHTPHLFRLAKLCYNQPTPLIVNDRGKITMLASAQGFRQGGVEAGLFFSIALRPKLEALRRLALPGGGSLAPGAYLDDTLVFAQGGDHYDRIAGVFASPQLDGLSLNPQKCVTYCLQDVHMDNSHDGIPILGAMVGPLVARRRFLEAKKNQVRWCLQRLLNLPSQVALRLLTQCFSRQCSHLLRSMNLDDPELQVILGQIDAATGAIAERIRCKDGLMPSDLQRRIYTLPQSMGGFGLLSLVEIYPAARPAAREAAVAQMRVMGLPYDGGAHAELPEPGGGRILSQRARTRAILEPATESFLATLSPDLRVVYADNASKIGSAWLSVNPCGKYRALTDAQVSAAMDIRLLLSSQYQSADCPFCLGTSVNPLHRECCVHSAPMEQSRHRLCRDAIVSHVRSSNPDRVVTPEPVVSYTPQQRRADIFVGDGANGNWWYDLKIKCVMARDAAAYRKQRREGLVAQRLADAAAAADGAANGAVVAGGAAPATAPPAPAPPEEEPILLMGVGGAAPAPGNLLDVVNDGGSSAAPAPSPPLGTAPAGAARTHALALSGPVTRVLPPSDSAAATAPDVAGDGPPPSDTASEGDAEGPPLAVTAPPREVEDGDHPNRSEAWREIGWALDVAVVDCRRQYARLNLMNPVAPLVISSGGSLHWQSYALIKDLIPDPKARRGLYIDLSLILVRARARVYSAHRW